MRRSRVSKTCEFPRRNGVFPRKWPSRAAAEGGGGGGRRQRRGMSRRGSKTPKTAEKCLVLEVRPMNSYMKLQFLLIRQSGRTPRTLFPPAESAIFRSEAAEKDLARKLNLKCAFLSESRNMLKMCVSRAFFAVISKSKGSKTPKTGEPCPVWGV